jgi:precorrin-2 dehydrogenase / sirohydrochlorin ferrochelatase
MNTLFPVFIKPHQLNLLIVGGGNVGEEKLSAILANSPDARVTVVAGYVKEEVTALARAASHVLIVNRNYCPSDLKGKDLVICATDNVKLHHEIRRKCRALNILVNVADTPELCDFYLGSVVRKGDLKIAVSTNGKSPTLAKRFREIMEEIIPDNIQDVLDNLEAIRKKLKGNFQYKVHKLNEITSVMRTEHLNSDNQTNQNQQLNG